MSIGYKLFTPEMRSISDKYGAVTYGTELQEVPGDGAYVARTLPGLLRGGYGPVLAEIEYEDPTGVVDDGHVVTARRVRVLRTATPDAGTWFRVAIHAAGLVPHQGGMMALTAVRAAADYAQKHSLEAAVKMLAAMITKVEGMPTGVMALWAMWAADAAARSKGEDEVSLHRRVMARLVAEAWPVEVIHV